MKIKAEILSEFLSSINLSNELEIKECIFRGDKDKLSVIAVAPSKVVIVKGELIGDFTDVGVVGIDNLTILKNLVKNLSGEIEITKTTNKLKINNGKKIKGELILKNPQYVLNEIDSNKYNTVVTKAKGNEFTLNNDSISEFSKYFSVFGKELIIKGDKNQVVFNLVNGDNELDISIDVPEAINKFESKFASIIMRLFEALKGKNVVMSIVPNAVSATLSFKCVEYNVEYIIAPVVK